MHFLNSFFLFFYILIIILQTLFYIPLTKVLQDKQAGLWGI